MARRADILTRHLDNQAEIGTIIASSFCKVKDYGLMRFYMRQFMLCLLFVTCLTTLCALPVSPEKALVIGRNHLASRDITASQLSISRHICSADKVLAYVLTMFPHGYVVVCADDDLPPVLAYSTVDSFAGDSGDLLGELLQYDLGLRWQQRHLASARYLQHNAMRWNALTSNIAQRDYQQWPPEGYSPTQGWIKTQWTQNAPYNNMCPMDPVTNLRSLAGCPAVAMAQIVNYHQSINGTSLNDADDYYHSYAGRNYHIDNDASTLDFPAFPELNAYLQQMMQNYKYQQPQTNNDKASLVFACAVAARQVFTSAGSGTFGVNQAMAAFQRFNFNNPLLVTQSSPSLYQHLAQNMMDALPAHLAVVTPAWDAGHNVVVDGYNTDGYFHINFGWGGTYNGWYLLPDDIPYDLTVLEGLILDIQPQQYLFSIPETIEINSITQLDVSLPVEIINLTSSALEIEAVRISTEQYYPSPLFEVVVEGPDLPLSVGAGQSYNMSIRINPFAQFPREQQDYQIRIIHSNGVYIVPVHVDMSIFSDVEDDVMTPGIAKLLCQPNPFSNTVTISASKAVTMPSRVEIFNLRGQKVRSMHLHSTIPTCYEWVWDGRADDGRQVPSGIYRVRWQSGRESATAKVLRIK
jgi:hypothetical protein